MNTQTHLCKIVFASGLNCKGRPQKGKDLCFRHDPDNIEKALQASQLGGLNRKKLKVYGTKRIKLTTPSDVRELVNSVMNDLYHGKMEREVANTFSKLGETWIKAYHQDYPTGIEKEEDNKVRGIVILPIMREESLIGEYTRKPDEVRLIEVTSSLKTDTNFQTGNSEYDLNTLPSKKKVKLKTI